MIDVTTLSPTDQLYRQVLFTPCESKEHLQDWIRMFLDLDFPDCTVDPESNSNPMDLLWEIYREGMDGTNEDFMSVLAYAARDSFKTLLTSALEVLVLVHLKRDIAHVAAILQQSNKAADYVAGFLAKPAFFGFVVTDNARRVEFVRYTHRQDGRILTEKEWKALPPDEKAGFERRMNYIHILVATVKSMNSEHVPFFCVTGDTQILTECTKNDNQRDRQQKTARGVFEVIAGAKKGGNPRKIETSPMDVPAPKKNINLLTLNLDSGSFEMKPVLRGHRWRRPVLRLELESGSLECTPDHPLYVWGRGFVQARKLVPGDNLLKIHKAKTDSEIVAGKESIYTTHPVGVEVIDWWDQVVMGSVLGDAGVYRCPKNNAYLEENRSPCQAEYLAWKRQIISRKVRTVTTNPTSGYTGEPLVGFRTGCSPIMNPYVNLWYELTGLERIGPLGLAVWYMDDGCDQNRFVLSTERYTLEQNERIACFLNERFGFSLYVEEYDRDGKPFYHVVGSVEDKRRLVDICAPYIHPQMAYKFDVNRNQTTCQFCGEAIWFYETEPRRETCNNPICQRLKTGSLKRDVILSIQEVGEKLVYDFTVADNHNFFTNGYLSKNCLDEVDLADPKALEEGRLIPCVRDGKFPITFQTSTRKTAFGPVQQAIDKAQKDPKYKLNVRHWNIIDVTQACPPERHLPEEGKIPIWVNRDLLEAKSESDYQGMNPEDRKGYERLEGYKGCLSKCRLFPACRGLLVDRQKSRSPLLKPHAMVTQVFGEVDTETALAQLLCLKPTSQGLIYPHFSREVHMRTAAEMASMMTGEAYPDTFGKMDLLKLAMERGFRIYSGMDWGFTHAFAVVTGILVGQNFYVVDCIEIVGLELAERIDICDRQIKWLNPIIYPDNEDPASIKTFRRHGYRMMDFKKDIIAGVNAVRWKLKPALGAPPQMYFLSGDRPIDAMLTKLAQYHWKYDTSNRPMIGTPDDSDGDDAITALRYVCQNLFGNRGRVVAASETVSPVVVPGAPANPAPRMESWMQSYLSGTLGLDVDLMDPDEGVVVGGGRDDGEGTGRKGGFVWSMD